MIEKVAISGSFHWAQEKEMAPDKRKLNLFDMKKPFIRKTHVFDATGKPLGRLASMVATLLTGKRKVGYRQNADKGDFVVINNISNIVFTGSKLDQKKYYRFSGYPGGLKETPAKRAMNKNASYVFRRAVERMLPKNSLAKTMIKRLRFEQ